MNRNYKKQGEEQSSSGMSIFTNTNVSLETLQEGTLQEVGYDGQEYHQYPPSLSEHFSHLLHQIDFFQDSAMLADTVAETQPDIPTTSTEPPWELTTSNLKNAATEVSVALDVLNITRQKQFMVLDPVPQETLEPKPISQIYSRKKGLCAAGNMLLAAAERLQANISETRKAEREAPDFNSELIQLRQNWRLKKVSDSVVGDLSYRTVGSTYPAHGLFEVTKGDDVSAADGQSSLHVSIFPELEGIAYIKVVCCEEREPSFSSQISPLASCFAVISNENMARGQKLEAAQNVLFCKELFHHLAKEAVYLENEPSTVMPCMIVGNQIKVTLFPSVYLTISLCHSTANNHPFVDYDEESDHSYVLEHSLHQLLKEVHDKNMIFNLPKPASGFLGPSKERYLAGPSAHTKSMLADAVLKNKTILEQIVEQAQRSFLRIKTEDTLDALAVTLHDPLMICHWNTLNAPTPSSVKVTILSHSYESLYSMSILLELACDGIKCVCRDGRVIKLGCGQDELVNFFLHQVQCYFISSAQSLARSLGWDTTDSNLTLGTGTPQGFANASSCLLSSSASNKLVAVRTELVFREMVKKQVFIADASKKQLLSSDLVRDKKWENLGGSFDEVDLKKIQGKNFLNKLEFIMASLTILPKGI